MLKFKTFKIKSFNKNLKFGIQNSALLFLIVLLAAGNFLVFPQSAEAAINERINYQGKLTDTTGIAVTDGDYRMYFRLYTAETGGSNIWEEDRSTEVGDRITLTSGLFSVMLGSSTVLTNINFNQTLYLGVEICGLGSGAESCDGEMIPRKVIGAVPAAFESKRLEGLGSSQFLRSDAVNSTTTSSTFLTITQNGAGNIADFYGPSSDLALSILSSGKISVGTSTPYADFTVWGTGDGIVGLGETALTTFNIVNNASTTLFTVLEDGKTGVGTSSPYALFSVDGESVADYFTSNSTTATSTFANHISIGSEKEYRINGIGILTKKSTGAVLAGDLGGDARGTDALDIQTTRTAAQVASGQDSTAMGNKNTASGQGSTAVGHNNEATALYSVAIGGVNSAGGLSTVVIGADGHAFVDYAIAIGNSSTLNSDYNIGIGNENNIGADSPRSLSMGDLNDIGPSAPDSIIVGSSNDLDGKESLTVGYDNTVTGLYRNIVVGNANTVSVDGASVFGNSITNSVASSTMIGPSNTAKITITSGGNLGIGTTTPARTLDVEGSFGGKYVTLNTTLTTTQTVTDSNAALSFYFHNNTGTTNASITITYSITGVPNNDGTLVFIRSAAEKEVTSAAQTSTVIVQINGQQVSSAATSNQTGANTRIVNLVVARLNGEWRRIGFSGADSNDIAEWISFSGDIPEAGQLLIVSPEQEESAEISPGIPYNPKLIGIVSSNPEILMGDSGAPLEKTMLALAGRVPVKVSSENGAIEIGDYITSSSQPGVGMKATLPGRVVGLALEDFDGGQVGEIIVMLNNTFYLGEDSQNILERIENLENLGGSSGSSGFSFNAVLNAVLSRLESLGVRIMDGVAYFKEIIAEKLTIGSPEKPAGITLYDEANGEPYCLSIKNGKVISQPGVCQNLDSATESIGGQSLPPPMPLPEEEETEPQENEDDKELENGLPDETPIDLDTNEETEKSNPETENVEISPEGTFEPENQTSEPSFTSVGLGEPIETTDDNSESDSE